MLISRGIWPRVLLWNSSEGTQLKINSMNNLEAILGDITTAQVDAIVNAANPMMLGGGGVDGAIHEAAGPLLLESCRKVKAVDGIRCPFGEARITKAGNLPAKYVVHAVGPIYRTDQQPVVTLASAYRNALRLAMQNGCRSIAFPAISCGAYGFPLDRAAEVAVQECSNDQYSHMAIKFYLFSTELYELWCCRIKNS